jgi:hypothetical protein
MGSRIGSDHYTNISAKRVRVLQLFDHANIDDRHIIYPNFSSCLHKCWNRLHMESLFQTGLLDDQNNTTKNVVL